MKKTIRLLIVVTAILIGMLYGCVSSQQKTSANSGFLGSYPNFSEGPEGVDHRYLKPGVNFTKYKKIMMDEVVFFFDTSSDYKGIHPSEITELSKKFHLTFAETFGAQLTDTSGPDVVRMRMAITDIEPSNTLTSTITTIVPVGLALNIVKKGAGGEYTGIGSASCEVEFLDSLTNERIAAAIDKAPGGKLDVGELAPVEAAFEYWAKRLSAFMNTMK